MSCVLYPHITSHVPGEYRCGGVTGDAVSYFQVTSVITYIEWLSILKNPEFPSAVMDGSLCSHIVKVSRMFDILWEDSTQVAPNVCSLRLDFINFSMSGGEGGGCNRDWFSIIGANDGEDVTGTLCGQQSGHSSKFITRTQIKKIL